jgi:amidohydrolase
MELKEKVKQLAAGYYSEIVEIRRYFHRNPELSFHENGTSAYIQEYLRAFDIPFQAGYVKTGILGTIEGKKSGKVIALRADMDALPIQEKCDIPFRSQFDGRMHACGHDMHMAALLGAARILSSLKDELAGNVLLVFQPAEEKLPGGASIMLEEGIFDKIQPDLIIGQHVMPLLEAGMVGYRPGMYMASSDEIYITVKGRGGHAAMPHHLTDTVLIAAQIIVGLQQIVSRNANATIPSVLSFGKLDAPGATNIIPSEVRIEGTFRTMDETWRNEAHKRITTLAAALAEGMGATCEVNILRGYPVLSNHEQYTRMAAEYSAELLGNDQVVDLELRMTSEDFAFFSHRFPSVFYRFGTTDREKRYVSPLHSDTYMADEGALLTAMSNLSWLTLCFLNNSSFQSLP